ncbi:phosphoribosyltransferase [Marinomonas mediterranea MMB-1]|jgi:Predicted amidophosphoribosyltransferases|uniref:Phosphoribosyltransferase n=1 Tax=Marinomonas mediterranea (strain ATCC 700492 / JCM 21426 / NBRC 103028 / MMB-1) TaxID=717774 RepID=F2K3M9_MARM1|nr:phosphoribosyltransferase [Marinomonas mediterranea MMB-1]
MDWSHLSTRLFTKIYYRSLIKQCYLCKQPSSSSLCNWCLPLLNTNQARCKGCGIAGKFPYLCGDCQSTTRPWKSCIVATDYEKINRHLIRAAKFHDNNYNFRIYCDLLAQKVIQHYKHDIPSLWVTVPSHIKRIRERGKCSNDVLYRTLKQSVYHISKRERPIQRVHLTKVEHTAPQHRQKRSKRLTIPTSLFKFAGTLSGHVVLIDDVMTTGATLEACTKTLLKAGASSVDVWVIARTPPSL